jgi:probable HAF family extracellular repeat protein
MSFSSLGFSQKVFTVVSVPGASPNSLIAINNNGQVVVNTSTSNAAQASLWSRLGGAQSLNLNATNSSGAAINNSGAVVGAGNPDSSGNLQSFLAQPADGAQWLPSLGGTLSAASGINDAGAVVGLSYTAAITQHAFLWTPTGGTQDLTPDLSSIGGATAVAINSSNQVAGYYFPSGSQQTLGFLWTQDGGLQNLGTAGTLAFSINNAGTVVGQAPFANANRHAFSWTAGGGIQDLGALGGEESSALSINNRGWIAGTSLPTPGKGLLHGFLWTPANGMQDFTVLAGLNSYWQISSAEVNDAGVIAISTNKGGYLLVPKMNETMASSANPSVLGQAVTFTVAVSSIAGPPPDGEVVQFTMGGKTLGSATMHGGAAQFTTSSIPVGSHVVQAKYVGDANYLAAKYTSIAQVVKQ